jgi:hypothetical protein
MFKNVIDFRQNFIQNENEISNLDENIKFPDRVFNTFNDGTKSIG